jgi:hypothetical protein
VAREWLLSDERAWELLQQSCAYCGSPPQIRPWYKINARMCADLKKQLEYETRRGTLDRIDSSKGYVEGNVNPCCDQCNTMKMDYTEEEFKAQIQRIYDHLNLGEKDKK